MDRNLQLNGFSVYLTKADGDTETVCSGVPGRDAALGLWHYTNNFSAKAGITSRVEVRDDLDKTVLAWEFERGYTFDGETFSDKADFNGLVKP